MAKHGASKQHVPVFVGSTYEDLKEYRAAVREALHRLEAVVRGMEYFGSKPGAPRDECLSAVQSCKVYIGIFAMRYGSIDDASGLSMTHLEYEEARKRNLPILIYMIDEDRQPVIPKLVETGAGAERLQVLKEELKKRYVVSLFTTPDDLARRITQDLPPILKDIGVQVTSESEGELLQSEGELLNRFRLRPKKYEGREVLIKCTVAGSTMATDDEDCQALSLPHGDAIQRRVESEHLGKWAVLIAIKEIADQFEELATGDELVAQIKLLCGEHQDVDYSDDGPIARTKLIRGYQIVKIVRINPNNGAAKVADLSE